MSEARLPAGFLGDPAILFRALIEHSWDAICLVSPEATFRYVSPATLRILGRTTDYFVGRSVFELLHPSDAEPSKSLFAELLQKPRGSVTTQVRYLHENGSWKWLDCIGTNLLEERAVQAVVVNFRDITDRTHAENVARFSSELNKQIIASAHDGIVVYDANLRYLLLNPYLEELGGMRTEEVVGKHPWDVFPFLREIGLEAILRKALRGETVIGPDLQYHMPRTGRSGWNSAHFFPLRNARGEIVGVIGTIRDITQQKQEEEKRRRLEVQMQHAQKLESLGVLAAGLAHDFNNLLTIVLGNAALAQQELPAGSHVRAVLKDIETAADGAVRLTRQMLAYGGKSPVSIQPVNLSEIVGDMTALLQSVASKKATLRFELAADLPLVEADATQLRQVVMNLATNASDALGVECGNIVIRTRAVGIEAASSHSFFPAPPALGTYASLEVEDSGLGMDEATRAKIFDPFFTTKSAGRGLGMSAVLGIVQGFRGVIGVRSSPGEGTTVQVLFPAMK